MRLVDDQLALFDEGFVQFVLNIVSVYFKMVGM